MNRVLIAVITILVFSDAVSGQSILPLDNNTGKVQYQEIVNAPGISKDVLFNAVKKWTQTKNSAANPYKVTYEHMNNGSLVTKGSFSLSADERKYTVAFVLNVDIKQEKYRYLLSDMVIKYTTQGGASTGGYGMWSSTTYRESEALEYSIETFYPIRLEKRRKPSIKWYEPINKDTFEHIDKEIEGILASLKQTIEQSKAKW